MTRMFFAVAMLCCFSSATSVHAVDVFGNGGSRSGTGTQTQTFGVTNGFAVPFRTGSLDAMNLVGGVWVLVGDNVSSSAGFNVSIYSDAGTNQGPTGSAVGSASSSRPQGSGSSWILVNFASPLQLSQNSNYYLSLIKTSGTFSELGWTVPTASPAYSDLGSNSGYSLTSGGNVDVYSTTNSGSTWSSFGAVSSTQFGFQIVPEPSTYVLAAVATAALGLTVRRKRFLSC